MATAAELAALSDFVYGNGDVPNGWDPIESPNETQNGYLGEIFYNAATNEVVVANRGTRPTSASDLRMDAILASGGIPPSDQDAYALALQAEAIAQSKGATLIETGHSLGGQEAAFVTATLANQGVKVAGVTFEAPGLPATIQQSGIAYNLSNFTNQGDVVPIAGAAQIGTRISISTAPANLEQLLAVIPSFFGPLGVLATAGLEAWIALQAHSIKNIEAYLGDSPALGDLSPEQLHALTPQQTAALAAISPSQYNAMTQAQQQALASSTPDQVAATIASLPGNLPADSTTGSVTANADHSVTVDFPYGQTVQVSVNGSNSISIVATSSSGLPSVTVSQGLPSTLSSTSSYTLDASTGYAVAVSGAQPGTTGGSITVMDGRTQQVIGTFEPGTVTGTIANQNGSVTVTLTGNRSITFNPDDSFVIADAAGHQTEVAPFVRTVFSIFKWNAGRSRCRFHRGQQREVSFIRGLVRQT